MAGRRTLALGPIPASGAAWQPGFIRRLGSAAAPSRSRPANDNGNGRRAGGAQRNPPFVRNRTETAGFASLHPPYKGQSVDAGIGSMRRTMLDLSPSFRHHLRTVITVRFVLA